MTEPSRLWRALDAVSQLCNVLLFDGTANHSISGDAYRYGRTRLQATIDFLFSPIESDHCRRAYLNDVRRARELIIEHESTHQEESTSCR